jgi:hypothetical protein
MTEDQKKWGAETGDCVPPGKSLLFDISLAAGYPPIASTAKCRVSPRTRPTVLKGYGHQKL